MIKFKTFYPCEVHTSLGSIIKSAANQINEWLEALPEVEVLSWQACPVGEHNELYITIQYKEYKKN